MTSSIINTPIRAGHAARSGPHPMAREGAALIRLALPIMLIALVNMGMSLTDTAMVSILFGAEALASVAVGSDLYSILFYLGAGTIAGITPFYTAAVVGADPAAVAQLRRTGHRLVALLAVVLVPVLGTAPDWLAYFGLDRSLLADGSGYTRAMALTLVPMLGVAFYRTILTAAERPKVFLKVTAAMLPLNAALNWVLMTGAGPFPALGPAGAGVSSLIVATMSLAILALVARSGTPPGHASASAGEVPSTARVLAVGLPIGVATVTELGIFLGATIYAATLGAVDVAAHTLVLRTAGVAYAVPAALLQAAMVRMARADALDEPEARRAVTVASLLLSLAGGTVICAALVLGAGPLARGFFDTSAVGTAAAGIASTLLALLGALEFIAGPGSAAAGLLRGRKDTRAPMVFTLVGYWAVGAPLGLWLCEAEGFGITGIWIGLAAGTLATTALSLIRLAGWRRVRGRAAVE